MTNRHFVAKICHFVVGEGLVPCHFSSKDFEILDLDPPNNLTSHYGACHFGYNLALSALKVWFCSQIKVNELIWQKSALKVSNEKLKGQNFSLGLRPRPRPSPCSKHPLFAIITNIYLAFLKKLCFFKFSPQPRRQRRTDRCQKLFCI